MFVALLIWRVGAGATQPGQRLLLGAFALTACWAWLSAISAGDPLASYAETARNLMWIGAALQPVGDRRRAPARRAAGLWRGRGGARPAARRRHARAARRQPARCRETATLLRITAAAGSLVLVHNLYGQAAPASRSTIRFAMLGLALIWIYDLNLYTIAYLDAAGAGPARLARRGRSR